MSVERNVACGRSIHVDMHPPLTASLGDLLLLPLALLDLAPEFVGVPETIEMLWAERLPVESNYGTAVDAARV